jgi:hypothetical protein
MISQPHNLLPSHQKRKIRSYYWLRAGTVFGAVGALGVLLASASLVPAYFLSHSELARIQADLESIGGVEDKKDTQVRVQEVRDFATLLTKYAEIPRVTGAINSVLEVRPSAVRVVRVSYMPREGRMEVEGFAKNRTALISYEESLKAQKGVQKLDRPISALTGTVDFPFTLKIYFSPNAE